MRGKEICGYGGYKLVINIQFLLSQRKSDDVQVLLG
jgi:hypothetical protein